MTTPAHCTRTDPHERHEIARDYNGTWTCPGVEPPADVQATPDPDKPSVPAWWTRTPAPPGLSAQEIRLRLVELGHDAMAWRPTSLDQHQSYVDMVTRLAESFVPYVEHGPDETPALRQCSHDLQRWADDLRRLTAAEDRADLADARLGRIAFASHDRLTDAEFRDATLAALTWTPDDTAPADTATGDGDGDE